MICEFISQDRQTGLQMVVADRLASGFPNLVLRIELWSSHREGHDFQTRIVRQDLPDGCAAMPSGSIPEQQDGCVWEGGEDLLQMLSSKDGIQRRGLHGNFLASVQVEGAIEVGFDPAGIRSHDRGLPARCPNLPQGSLQIENGFVFGHDHGFRRLLEHIDQFFSSCSSKSATWA